MAGFWAVQDCGKPYNLENYIAFFEALRAVHPQLRLVANCNMGSSAPTDLYDWHVYTGAQKGTESCYIAMLMDASGSCNRESGLG